ncbi:GerMN domain-containing protein [Clostridium oryzae]|nr:GerMN domain-containing protein [Clostridium oryzae]
MKSFIAVSLILMSAASISACSNKDNISTSNKEKIETVRLPHEKNGFIDLDIYFPSAKKNSPIDKEEVLINKEELMGEVIINEIIKGPSVESHLKPVIPPETKLMSFSIKDGIAIVNLSKDAEVKMSYENEKACLQSIANSLSQLEVVHKVKILVQGNEIESLGGNFNISKPFSASQIDSLRIKKK